MSKQRDQLDDWLDERRAENLARAEVLQRAEQMGIQAKPVGGWGNTTRVTMTAAELARLLDLIEAR